MEDEKDATNKDTTKGTKEDEQAAKQKRAEAQWDKIVMDNSSWWLLVPGVFCHAILTFAVYETIRLWPFTGALSVHEVHFQRFSAETSFTVWLQTLGAMAIAFFVVYLLACRALSHGFKPSAFFYQRALRRKEAEEQLPQEKEEQRQ